MSQEQQQIDREFDFAHGRHFMDSIRSSGYKNAAMAIGELVDNSIQAEAKNIDILVREKRNLVSERRVRQINQIAVLDDGTGMDKDLLRRSLKLGDGTHFEDDGGIGKFGVGLPQASVSQAKQVDVWTWQDGIDSAHHTWIDLTDDEWVESGIIPKPEEKSIPGEWREMAEFDDESGTLVVWSTVDRCNWQRARTLFRHSQELIGRMYRNWLHHDTNYRDVDISLILYDEDEEELDKTWEFQPNDPLYLMEDTSVELPDQIPDPMFEQVAEPSEPVYNINLPDGEETQEKVKITFSISKPETRQRVDGNYAGSASHGKHAKDNIGLSIVREGRELTLDKNWAGKDPRNRWWGAQIEFGRAMDEIFGVTNNKQGADRLSEVANADWDDYAEDGESTSDTRDRLKQDDFPTYVCLDIKHRIEKTISEQLMEMVKEIGEYSVDDKDVEDQRHEDSPERHATEVTEDRQESGQTGQSDEEIDLSEEEVVEQIETRLEEQGVDDETINQVKGDIVDHGLKYSFVEKSIPSNLMFSVEPTAGAILIGLNKDHIAYSELFSSLDLENEEELDEEEAAKKLEDANDALKLLLEAWARMEDETTGDEMDLYRDIRSDWGRMARDFLKESRRETEIN
jgi:hypothetical protein